MTTVLLREAIGDRLRRTRTEQHRTLREVSRTAKVSLGYLSEVERGRKEASSELLAAICDALDLPLSDLLQDVAGDLSPRLVDIETVDRLIDVDRAIEGGRLVPAIVGESKADLVLARPIARHLGGHVSARATVAA